jgi:hypothetical protein
LSNTAPARSERNEQDVALPWSPAEWFAEQDDSYQKSGITAEHVVTAAKASLARVRAR